MATPKITLPPPDIPMTDKDGKPNPDWYRKMLAIVAKLNAL